MALVPSIAIIISVSQSLNVAVVGSEIVGLVPLAPMLMAAQYYIDKEGLFVLHEHHKIRLVIQRLGLDSITEFKPQEKIIESAFKSPSLYLWFDDCVGFRYCIGSNKDGPLVGGSLRAFVEKLGARSSAPGGGSAAACIASLVSVPKPFPARKCVNEFH